MVCIFGAGAKGEEAKRRLANLSHAAERNYGLFLSEGEGDAARSPSESERGHGSEKRSFSESARARPSGFSALGKIRVATGGNPELFAAEKIEACRR